MSNYSVYFHGENVREMKSVEVPEHATVKEIILLYVQEFPNAGDPEVIELFLEDEDLPKEKHHHAREGGVIHHGHIHFHRCKKVEVVVIYNGDHRVLGFAPATTIRRVLEKALEAFNINPRDAGDYLLKLNDRTALTPKEHLGSFTSHPGCQVKLFLTAAQPIQG